MLFLNMVCLTVALACGRPVGDLAHTVRLLVVAQEVIHEGDVYVHLNLNQCH
jgi:hypothetical protein